MKDIVITALVCGLIGVCIYDCRRSKPTTPDNAMRIQAEMQVRLKEIDAVSTCFIKGYANCPSLPKTMGCNE